MISPRSISRRVHRRVDAVDLGAQFGEGGGALVGLISSIGSGGCGGFRRRAIHTGAGPPKAKKTLTGRRGGLSKPFPNF